MPRLLGAAQLVVHLWFSTHRCQRGPQVWGAQTLPLLPAPPTPLGFPNMSPPMSFAWLWSLLAGQAHGQRVAHDTPRSPECFDFSWSKEKIGTQVTRMSCTQHTRWSSRWCHPNASFPRVPKGQGGRPGTPPSGTSPSCTPLLSSLHLTLVLGGPSQTSKPNRVSEIVASVTSDHDRT